MSEGLTTHSASNESPQQVGQVYAMARWRLVYWSACIERTGDEDHDTLRAADALVDQSSSIEAALDALFGEHDPTALSTALAPVLYAGLGRRQGLYLAGMLGSEDLWLFRLLQDAAGLAVDEFPDPPVGLPRLHVCGRCTIVFAPSRKASVRDCPECHAHPHREPPCRVADWTLTPTGPTWRFTGAGPEPAGYRRRCEICGSYFDAKRSDARVCGARCGKAHTRKSNRAHGLS